MTPDGHHADCHLCRGAVPRGARPGQDQRPGRTPPCAACYVCWAPPVGYFIFGIGGALWILFLSRLIDGITGGNISTASAYIVDVSKPEERTKNFTLLGMAYGLGFILGPALGGALGQWNLNAPRLSGRYRFPG